MEEKLKEYYREIGSEIQSEISKASQLLGFLGILIFVALGKLGEVDFYIKVVIFILMVINVMLLLYTILGKGYLGMPKTFNNIIKKKNKNTKYLKQNYEIAYGIWKEKHKFNFISFILLVILFIFIIFSIFFL